MKTTFGLFILLMVFFAETFGQAVPAGINYQAIARTASGSVYVNRTIKVRLSILQGSSSGIVQYAETQLTKTNEFGLFSLKIGGGAPASGTFSTITWNSANHYLKVEVDPNGGDNFIDLGTIELLSVPYAFYAQSSGDPGTPGPVGPIGPQGPAGPQGQQGIPGPAGPTGPMGDAGPQGLQGVPGPTGLKGDTGPAGPQGLQGVPGPTGLKGDTGPAGPQGLQGVPGPTGLKGDTGPAGPQGLQGVPGPTGLKGDIGPAGPQGLQGVPGPTGPKGDTGPAGPQGLQGVPGPTGSQGPSGPQGQQGVPGPTGPQGLQGPTGPQGPAGIYQAGPGITINTGTTPPTLSAQNTTALWNANQLQGNSISSTNPSTNQVLQWNGSSWAPASIGGTAPAWELSGNTGTSAGINFIGTTDAKDFVAKTNNVERMRITSSGNTGIGISTPSYPLEVKGSNAAAASVITNTAPGANVGIVGLGNGLSSFSLPTYGGVPAGAGGAFYGNTYGAYGYTSASNSAGVYGRADNSGVTYAVLGRAHNLSGQASNTGSGGAFIANQYGLSAYQYTTQGQTAAGIFIAGDGIGGSDSQTLVEAYSSTGTHYKIWQNALGAVSTAVPDLNGNPATLHAIETPEFYFQDYGQGKLLNGKAHIDLDPILAKNVIINERHPLRVFVQLEGDCNGVYVTNKTATGFDVVELSGGKSNVSFQWSVTCNVADARIGNRLSKFSDLRFEPGPEIQLKSIDDSNVNNNK